MSSRPARALALLVLACLLAAAPAAAATRIKVRQATKVSGATVRVTVKVPKKKTAKARATLQRRSSGKWTSLTTRTVKKGRVVIKWSAPSADPVRLRLVVRRKGRVIGVSKSWVAKPKPPAPAKPAPTPAPTLPPAAGPTVPVAPPAPGPARVLAAGGHHACAIAADRGVRCWGENASGAVGDGSRTDRFTAVPVAGLAGIVTVAAGDAHTCALRSDGTVWCWGDGSAGQLAGLGSSPLPTQLPGLADITDLRAGGTVTCALPRGRSWRCWGGSAAPTELPAGAALTALETGSSCLASAGALRCSGTGATLPADSISVTTRSWASCGLSGAGVISCAVRPPANVTGPLTALTLQAPGATSIALADLSLCAARPGATVRCWNLASTLSGGAAPVPVDLAGTAGAVELAGADGAVCARHTDRSVRCFGTPAHGMRGDGRNERIGLPVESSVVASASRVSLDGSQGCALVSGGVTCWGLTSRGSAESYFAAGPLVPGSGALRSVSTIARAACGTKDDRAVVCWGTIPAGGAKPTDYTYWTAGELAGIIDLGDVTEVAGAAGSPTCALRAGDVVCWGTDEPEPGPWVPGSPRGAVAGFAGATRLVSGGGICAIVAEGVRCQARDTDGLGGRPATHAAGPYGAPLTLDGTAGATDLDIDQRHGCLVAAQQVRCWGANEAGQLGRSLAGSPDPAASPNPAAVGGLGPAKAVAVGAAHSCAILTGGTVACWGANNLAQLGDPGQPGGAAPVPVPGISDAVTIAAGGGATCVTRSAHRLTCWGEGKLLPYSTRATDWIGVPVIGVGPTAG